MAPPLFSKSLRPIKNRCSDIGKPSTIRLAVTLCGVLLSLASPSLAQTSPWESAVGALQTSMTGPIAKGCALVAIVVGGLMFAFGEGGSKKMLSGIIFGLGMALSAANFVSWLFPSS